MNDISLNQLASASITRKREPLDSDIGFKGRFVVQHWRDGKRINEYHFDNAVTNEGKNAILGVQFKSSTQRTTWYLGLISSTGYTSLQATDDYADINQSANLWTEFAGYTDDANTNSAVTRPAWNMGSVSAQSLTSLASSVFDITSAGTVKGLFAVAGANAQTKSDHTAGNQLWSTALFTTGDVVVASGDQLKVTYTVSAS